MIEEDLNSYPRLFIRVQDLRNIPLDEIEYQPVSILFTLHPVEFLYRFPSSSNYTFHDDICEFPIANPDYMQVTISVEKSISQSEKKIISELTLPLNSFPKSKCCRGSFIMKPISLSKSPIITLQIHVANKTQHPFSAHRSHINKTILNSFKSSLKTHRQNQQEEDSNASLTDIFFEIFPKNLWPLIHDPNFIEFVSNSDTQNS